MKLVIFDLDQTLVNFLPVHNRATCKLFRRFFNVDARLTEIDFAGKSLMENFIELARLKHIPEEDVWNRREEILKYYDRAFGETMPRSVSKYILPGAKKLLNRLSRTDNIVVLYTGDSAGIVRRVFRATDLGKYFKFALYGTEARARIDMVVEAIRKAEKVAGVKFKYKNVVIIGDSFRDIECGKHIHALTIAVATGFYSEEELWEHRPDYLFSNLRNYKKILEIIG